MLGCQSTDLGNMYNLPCCSPCYSPGRCHWCIFASLICYIRYKLFFYLCSLSFSSLGKEIRFTFYFLLFTFYFLLQLPSFPASDPSSPVHSKQPIIIIMILPLQRQWNSPQWRCSFRLRLGLRLRPGGACLFIGVVEM